MFEATLLLLGGSVDLSRWVGALKAIEQSHVEYPRIVASSTASPVAAFIAAGYTIGEIQKSWDEFKAGTGAQRIDASELEQWVRDLLKLKSVETFGDLKGSGPELKLLVQDVNNRKSLVLPDDAEKLGLQADELSVVSAVRASMGIPDVAIFAPVRLGTRELVGCYWRSANASLAWDQIVMRRTTPLSFYSEPIIGARTMVRRLFSPRSRSVLKLDKALAQSRYIYSILSEDVGSQGLFEATSVQGPAPPQIISLKSLPSSWFNMDSAELLEAASNETKRELGNLGISFGAENSSAGLEAFGLSAEEEAATTEGRHINAWIVDGEPPLERGHEYKFAINVGKLCEHAVSSTKLREFDWKDSQQVDVWIVLSGRGFIAKPRQQLFTLPKEGDTDPIFFAITPAEHDSLLLRISVYFARELTLLQEFEVPIAVKESVEVKTG